MVPKKKARNLRERIEQHFPVNYNAQLENKRAPCTSFLLSILHVWPENLGFRRTDKINGVAEIFSFFPNIQKLVQPCEVDPDFQKFLFHLILLPEFMECFITWKLHSATNSYSYILFSCRNVANPCQAMWRSNLCLSGLQQSCSRLELLTG